MTSCTSVNILIAVWCDGFSKFYVLFDVRDKYSTLLVCPVLSDWCVCRYLWCFVCVLSFVSCIVIMSMFCVSARSVILLLSPFMLICNIFSDVGPGCGWMSPPSRIRAAIHVGSTHGWQAAGPLEKGAGRN